MKRREKSTKKGRAIKREIEINSLIFEKLTEKGEIFPGACGVDTLSPEQHLRMIQFECTLFHHTFRPQYYWVKATNTDVVQMLKRITDREKTLKNKLTGLISF